MSSDDESGKKLASISEVIRQYDLRPRKHLGQHYLLDPNITARIATAAGNLDTVDVLEIGPGPGALTRALLHAGAKHVTCIEYDSRFLPALRQLEITYPGRLSVICSDALSFNWNTIIDRPAQIVANLPYNIATPLLFKWRGLGTQLRGMTLMFQKEVAMRLIAKPRTSSYGRLSVMSQWRCMVEHAFDIPSGAFKPKPRITSSVVSLKPRRVPLAPADSHTLELVVKIAFNQRRKMLRTSLKALYVDPMPLLNIAGVNPTDRPDALSIEEFCAIARAYGERTI